MTISSHDALIAALTAGQTKRLDYQKIITPAHTAGRWHELSGLAGSPVANTWPGASLAFVNCNESAGNGTEVFGIQHGGDVSTMTKHVASMAASITAAAGAPWLMQLIDLVGYYPLTGTDVTGVASRALTGTPTHRYTGGEGVRAFFVVKTAPLTGGPTLSAISYTNSAGTPGRTTIPTVQFNAAANAYATAIPHSGIAANNHGPFLPMMAGDQGVRSVESFTLSGGTAYTGTGVLVLALARPIGPPLPIAATGQATERDLVNMLSSLPQIKDGACLSYLLYANGATTNNAPVVGFGEAVWN